MRKILERIEKPAVEERCLARFISRIRREGAVRVLDVGCGYGRNLRLLGALGCDVLGVDANADIVAANVREGMPCMTPEQFAGVAGTFDAILMAHVIEHLPPHDLLSFLDRYLVSLKSGGYLIIATPLLSPYFYDDFDHIRPYTPAGIAMVLGGGSAQVQYYGISRIELVDLWYRRAPLRVFHYRGRWLGGQYHVRLLNLALALLYHATGHAVGVTDGWVGLFRKRS